MDFFRSSFMTDYLLPKNHITLQSATDIKLICETHLKPYGMTHFMYTRLFNDGSRFSLTSRPDWFQHFIEKRYFNYSRLDRHASCYKSGYFLWDAWSKDCPAYTIVLRDAEKNFNKGSGFSIIKTNADWADKYDFASTPFNVHMNQFYLNRIDWLDTFILLFNDKAHRLIEQASEKREFLPYDIDIYQEYPDTCLPREIISAYSISMKNLTLTQRELECIYWLIKGKSAPQIAMILRISSRTVEKFISTIKLKFGCNTLFQLGQRICELKLDKFLSNIN